MRRTKDEARATREALLDAAESVFRRNGVTGTTLAEVAAAAGLTRGAIYWHFRDKAELFEAMCNRASLPLEAVLQQAATAEENDALASLRDVAVRALREIAANPRTRAVLEILLHKTERAGGLAESGPRPEEIDRRCVGSVECIVQRAIAQRALPADTDAARAAWSMHAYVRGILEMWLIAPGAFDLAAAAPALIDTMIAGLRTAPPRQPHPNAASSQEAVA